MYNYAIYLFRAFCSLRDASSLLLWQVVGAGFVALTSLLRPLLLRAPATLHTRFAPLQQHGFAHHMTIDAKRLNQTDRLSCHASYAARRGMTSRYVPM